MSRSREVAQPRSGGPALAPGPESFILLPDPDSATDSFDCVRSVVRHYARGAAIYRQGERGSDFYRLVSGRVRIHIAMANGAERVLSFAEPGSTFGESACFDDRPYYTSAVAVRPSEVRVIGRHAVLQAARDQPEVLHDVFRALVRKQRQLAMHVAAQGLPAGDRAVLLLSSMVDVYGDAAAGGRQVRLHPGLTIEELASMVGVNRVTMSRELSDLVRRGVLAKQGLDIIVLDPQALHEAAARLGV